MRAAPLKNSSYKHYCAVIRFELSYLSILLTKRMAVSVAPPYRRESSRLLIGILANFYRLTASVYVPQATRSGWAFPSQKRSS